MQSTIDKLKWIFVGVFALTVAGLWTYDLFWVRPQRECEAKGRWWAAPYRTCAIPISLTTFTGRPNGARAPAAPPAAASGAPAAPPVK
jgi:hypothetical protein